jgi:hypothetical protein
LDLDVQEYDREGQPTGKMYVYLLGVKLRGSAARGHWIELIDEPEPDGRVRRLRDLTTGTEVSSKSSIFFPGS